MSSSHRDQKGVMNSLRNAGAAIKRSPQMLRKKISAAKKRMGGSKEYSALEGCADSGWLWGEEEIVVGKAFAVTYLGSVETSYDPRDSTANQVTATKAMDALYAHTRGHGQKTQLTISAASIQLKKIEDNTILMRHSVSRIAYSTVHVKKPKIFCYVALVKGTGLPLCHIFVCKNAKIGYDMTFTAAQAFDTSYRRWQSNKGDAALKAAASERGDVEPAQAWQKKNKDGGARATPPPPSAVTAGAAAISTPPPIRAHLGSSSEPARSSSLKPPSPPVKEKTVEEEAADYFESLQTLDVSNLSIDMDHPDEVDDEDDDQIFSALSAARSEPHLLDIGVDPEDYAAAKAGRFDDEEEES